MNERPQYSLIVYAKCGKVSKNKPQIALTTNGSAPRIARNSPTLGAQQKHVLD
jgi:hypothetical protein